MRLVHQEGALFRNLAHINICITVGFEQVFHFLLTDGMHFHCLKKIHADLKPIEIRHCRLFQQVLEKYQNQLESLTVILPTMDLDNDWIIRILTIPPLVNLKELDMDFGESNPTNYSSMLNIKFGFGDNLRLNYDVQLPALHTLSISFNFIESNGEFFWDKYSPFFKLFFPKDTTCYSLRRLNLPFIDQENEQMHSLMKQLSKMFPNVHNPWINKSREEQ